MRIFQIITKSFRGNIGVSPVFFRLGGGTGSKLSPFGGNGGFISD